MTEAALPAFVSLTLLKQVAFVGFFLLFGLAVYLNTTRSRQAALVILLASMLVAGLVGVTVWPFASWHLFTRSVDDTEVFYEFRVVDASGQEFKYDARAAKPALATPIRRYAKQLVVTATSGQRRTLSCYLLAEAEDYQATGALHGRPVRFLKFPPHQIGHEWSRATVEGMGELVAIRAYSVRVSFAPGDDTVVSHEETLEFTVTAEQCS